MFPDIWSSLFRIVAYYLIRLMHHAHTQAAGLNAAVPEQVVHGLLWFRAYQVKLCSHSGCAKLYIVNNQFQGFHYGTITWWPRACTVYWWVAIWQYMRDIIFKQHFTTLNTLRLKKLSISIKRIFSNSLYWYEYLYIVSDVTFVSVQKQKS